MFGHFQARENINVSVTRAGMAAPLKVSCLSRCRSVTVDITEGEQECSPLRLADQEPFQPFLGLDSNPLRSLLESHPPFSVELDLAPPEDPPENDYEDTLRTRHAPNDSDGDDDSSSSPV